LILNKIILTDFGLYRGEQEIDLSPKRTRSIILIGGMNGAGKTTLLEAIKLCFYGQSWSSGMTSRSKYESYLKGRIHRNPNALLQPSSASIEVEFQVGEVSGVHLYAVKRSWTAKAAGKITEYFVILKDGQLLDEVSEEHWQDFVRDLIPSGISQLFFFDGEKIQQLAEDDTDQATLADSIKSLLGVDVIERLSSDLAIFRSKVFKASGSSETETQLGSIEKALHEIEKEEEKRKIELQQHRSAATELQAKINHVEEQIAALGGNFAKRRGQLSNTRAELKAKIGTGEEAIRDLAANVLPFCLIPELGAALKGSLKREEAVKNSKVLRDAILIIRQNVHVKLAESMALSRSRLDSKQREELHSELEQAIVDAIDLPEEGDTDTVHNLSPEQADQLLVALEQAQSSVPVLKRIARELELAYRELQKVERDLKNAPTDESIRPFFQELSSLHQQQAEANLAALECDKRLKEISLSMDEKRRMLSKLAETLAASEGRAESIRRASQIQLALEDFKTTLIEKRVEQLQRYLTEAFNLLCRKKDALRGALIDSRIFSVVLLDRYGRPLLKSELSAGEKQIYAISVLWALSKTSGRPLPTIIDTPLARLDGDHRRALAQHYFPFASQQTVILSTDTEIDQAFFEELQPNVARSYRLEYSEIENATSIRSGYFWSKTA
jgi:DNA sulfur modification protein DndD